MQHFETPEGFFPMHMNQQPIWNMHFDQNVNAAMYPLVDEVAIQEQYQSTDYADRISSSDPSGIPSPDSVHSSSSTSRRMSTRSTETNPKIAKRREQNRQAQRAYRDRKEKQQRDLEAEIVTWKEKHDYLTQSLEAQSVEIRQLKAQIRQLTSQMATLQAQSKSGTEIWQPTEGTKPNYEDSQFETTKQHDIW